MSVNGVTLRVVDTGHWGHQQTDRDDAQTDSENGWSTGREQRPTERPHEGRAYAGSDLWEDDRGASWSEGDVRGPAQVPQHRDPRHDSGEQPVVLPPENWYSPPQHRRPANYEHPASAQVSGVPVSSLPTGDPTVGTRPAAGGFDEPGDLPGYGRVFAFTAGWFCAPTVLYLLGTLLLTSERRALVLRAFGVHLPWLVGALAISAAVAAALRWATLGWRALWIGFASAVIGAGVATIAYSLGT